MDTTDHAYDDARLDDELRQHLVATDAAADALVRSQRAAAHALDDAIAAERSRAWRPRRVPLRGRRWRSAALLAGGLAVALLVAGALAPLRDGAGDGAPLFATNATAAEVLEQAAAMLARDGGATGRDGSWHGVLRVSDGTLQETWYDPAAGVARYASYTPALGGAPATYYVLGTGASGTGSLRQYEQVGQRWRPQVGVQGDQLGGSEGGLVMSADVFALRWLQSVSTAASERDVRIATEQYLDDVRGTVFWVVPGVSREDEAAALAHAMLNLITTARLEPAAISALYRATVDVDSLQRIDDGTIDGRDVVRVRMYEITEVHPGSDQLQNVLVIDARDGLPVAIENEGGTRRTRIDAPRQVQSVGSGAVTCGAMPLPPCDLLAGTGPIAAAADRAATRTDGPPSAPSEEELASAPIVSSEVPASEAIGSSEAAPAAGAMDAGEDVPLSQPPASGEAVDGAVASVGPPVGAGR